MEYVYGALLLHKLGRPVDAEHLHKVVAAAGATVDDSKVKTLVASLKDVNIEQELANASLAVAVAPTSGAATPAAKQEEKKKEEKKEEAAEGLSALFG